MANTVEVSSNIWNWINTSVQVPAAVREKFEQWRSGEKKPTFSQLEEFSRKIHVPIGYFFLERQPQEQFKLIEFRTVDSRQLQDPSRELIDTLRQMESIQEWMRDDMIAGENEENRYVGSLRGKKGVAELAAMVRETLQYYQGDISIVEKGYGHPKSVFSALRDENTIIFRMFKNASASRFVEELRCLI